MKKSSRPITLTPDQVNWLRRAHDELGLSVPTMANHLNVHPDTLKRLLDRHGIRAAISAKHITPTTTTSLWSRPCLSCSSTSPRPRNQYICDSCKADSLTDGLPDEYFFYY